MSKVKPVLILWSLLLTKLLLGCGMLATDEAPLQKSFLILNVKMVGLPLTSKYAAKPENFSFSVSGCSNDKLNGTQRIQFSGEKTIIELPGKTDGCRFVLGEMRILEQGQSMICDSRDPEGPLAVLSGEFRVFECGNSNKIEIVVERGIPETNQDVFDVNIGLKPIFAPVAKYSDATYTDSNPENSDGLLYLSDFYHASSSVNKKYRFFNLEFACPDLIQTSSCQGTDLLSMRIIILNEGESNLGWNSLAAIARNEQRPARVKRENITLTGIKLLLDIGTWENKTLGVLLIDGERMRLFQIRLPENRER